MAFSSLVSSMNCTAAKAAWAKTDSTVLLSGLSLHRNKLPRIFLPAISGDATRFIRKTSYFPGADAAANDDLDFDANTIPKVFDSLNTLASCPWRVNQLVRRIINTTAFI